MSESDEWPDMDGGWFSSVMPCTERRGGLGRAILDWYEGDRFEDLDTSRDLRGARVSSLLLVGDEDAWLKENLGAADALGEPLPMEETLAPLDRNPAWNLLGFAGMIVDV